MHRFMGILGMIAILGLAYAISNNRRQIDWKLVIWGIVLQVAFAAFILMTPIGRPFFSWVDTIIRGLLSLSDKGSDFLFSSYVTGQVEAPLMNFAFRVLPTIIFFSALMAGAYHLGIMQWIVKWIARGMQKTLGTSGSETLSASANIFVGQTESPLLIRPFIEGATKSELMAIMTAGFATVAGGVMALYVKMLSDIPGIAGHLMAASIMSAPAALVIAKIIYPETQDSLTAGDLKMEVKRMDTNLVEAVGRGATDGMTLALNVAAMLVAFVALIAGVNVLLGLMGLSLEQILGWVFRPLAWTMGVPWQEAGIVGSLMGQKLVLTELIAYSNLSELLTSAANPLSLKSEIIASYALCGFANFASVGIQIGGIGGIAPSRRGDLAALAFRAMFGGALASWLTASLAGLML
ncbi:MAG: NupC/NupG family nucleoside CNT transporter [Lentisphaeria bacterium]|nr:NupC/NupG family nucleoside CNT transporter [Candidatus Neomarinimicrobiota bacterium]MCF7841645.1 NupC/NupG family nucleoside CNT transporter [Lentisphaeria bacterium]